MSRHVVKADCIPSRKITLDPLEKEVETIANTPSAGRTPGPRLHSILDEL